MIAFISLRSQAATQKNLLLLCQSLEIMCKLRVRLHIFCGHGHIKMYATCKAALVMWWLNWPPFEMEGRGSGDEATGGRQHFVRAAPCSRRPHRFRVANVRPHVTSVTSGEGFAANERGVSFEIPRAAAGSSFKFLSQLIFPLGHVLRRDYCEYAQ